MMTTNLFVIANVKQLRTDGSFWILLPFFRTSLSVGFLNSAIFNSFHSRVEFGKILVGLRKFEGGLNNLPPPPGTPPPEGQLFLISKTFAVFWMLRPFFWVILLRLSTSLEHMSRSSACPISSNSPLYEHSKAHRKKKDNAISNTVCFLKCVTTSIVAQPAKRR